MLTRCLAFCWCLPLLLVGSGGASPNAVGKEGEATALANTRWILVRLAAEGVEQPLDGSKTTLHFDAKNGMDGMSAINDYNGQYIADPTGLLRWPTPIHVTRLGGSGKLLRLESIYLSSLSKTERWEVLSSDRKLRLSTADGKAVLIFQPVPAS